MKKMNIVQIGDTTILCGEKGKHELVTKNLKTDESLRSANVNDSVEMSGNFVEERIPMKDDERTFLR